MIQHVASAMLVLAVVFLFAGLFAAYTMLVHIPLKKRIWRKK